MAGRFRTKWSEAMGPTSTSTSTSKGGRAVSSKAPLINPLELAIQWPMNICIAGTTGSGKTQLLRSIVAQHVSTWQKVIAFVGSGQLNGDYDWVEPGCLFSPDDDGMEVLGKVVQYQERLVKAGYVYPILIIFDDFVGSLALKGATAKLIDKLISSGRHMNISVVFLTQRLAKHVTPTIRDNCRMWFIMSLQRQSITGIVYDQQSDWTDKDSFWDAYSTHRRKEPFGPMVVQTAAPGQPGVIMCKAVNAR